MAGSAEVEARKIQRLGTSSLVVTLPKSWADRVNLKPGDTVYVVVEGETVRIVPGTLPPPEPMESLVIELSDREADILASHVVKCLYVLGYSNVKIKLGKSDINVINKILESAQSLLGAEASCIGDNTIRFTVPLDASKLGVKDAIHGIVRNLSIMIGALADIVASHPEMNIDKVKLLYNEIYRLHNFIIREMILFLRSGRVPLGVEAPPYIVLNALSLLGEASSLTLRAAEGIARFSRVTRKDKETVKAMADDIKVLVERLGAILVEPSVENAVKLLEDIGGTRAKYLKEPGTPLEAYIQSKLEDVLDLLRVAGIIALCAAIEARLKEKPGGR